MKYPVSQSEIIDKAYVIIADTLATYDIFFESESAREIEYRISEGVYLEFAKLDKYDYLRDLITDICNNHDNINFYDTSNENINTILRNSVINAEQQFKDIAKKQDYKDVVYTLDKRNENIFLSDRHETILYYLNEKFKDPKAVRRIADLLEITRNNFILKNKSGEYYFPVVSDFLFDLFYLEYFFFKDASFTKPFRNNIFEIKKNQIASDLRLSTRLYSKVVFVEKVKLNNVQTYLLKEFTRTLKCDEKLLRKLFIELLYLNPHDGKSAFLGKVEISEHYPKIFMLNKTKMIIQGDDIGTSLSTIQDFAVYRKLKEDCKI